jgi:S-formylglutathione hydrolase
VPWGLKAFEGYLGADRDAWLEYDATELVQRKPRPDTLLIDQGLDDKFLAEQLRPDVFEEACHRAGQSLVLHRHAGYDHGYYFIQTFMAAHLAFHARALTGA